ncbi:type IX secretion system sortase PorU [Corallibacter vietnamensis]
MKKKSLLFAFLLFLTMFCFSQQKRFEIQWTGTKTLSNETFSLEVPAFNDKNFNYSLDKGLQFIEQWDVAQALNEQSVSVTNVSYQNISRNELKGLNINNIPNTLTYELKNAVARNKRSAFFSISPIVKQNGVFKKITAFTINYANGNVASRNNSFSSNAIINSVLETGQWFRFYVNKSGVHQISKAFLQQMGININTIDPRTIKLYGNGGKMIPYANSEPYPIDLQENAIRVVGEEDGFFHEFDYILFYAQGPEGDIDDTTINTHINPYTDTSYYYINISPGNGKRIQPFLQPSGNPDITINTFHDYQYHELDEYNLVNVGRRWFGDRFDVETNKTFDFVFPDLVTSEPVKFKTIVASASEAPTSMQVKINGTDVANLVIPEVSDSNFATEASFTDNVTVNSGMVSVNYNFDNSSNPSASGYIDYIALEATRALNFPGTQFKFYNKSVAQTSGIGEYNMTNASQVSEVWNITDIYNVTTYVNSNASANISFKSTLGSLKKYVAVTPLNYYQPLLAPNPFVFNQNLKGTIFQNEQGQFQDIDYLIITPALLYNQAERLAQINRVNNGLTVKVVTLDQIYLEFSSGNQDVGAIRNFVKYVYDNASSPENKLKYLCMFGDASFDYKDRIQNNTNIVPSWHAYESFNLTSSFISDDFFGMMDSNEGSMHTADKLDIAVGRILAASPQQANELLAKIENYYSQASYGNWRNNFVVISDDIDEEWERVLQETTDHIADEVSTEKPFINAIKIHADAFQQESTAGGQRYPTVNTAVINAIENGALVVNYFGHGGEDGLAQERIFDKSEGENLNNVCKQTCFITVTCEYTRFDNPFRPTAGEFIYWNKNGGAIGLITTTRQIFVNVGISFNTTLDEYLFSFSDNDDYDDYEYPTMAEALRLTKVDPQISGISQRRLVFFIGDPAMKLAFPEPQIRLTHINDNPIGSNSDVLQALSHAKLAGEVTDLSGNVLSNYNGELSATIYDKNVERQTLANDRVREGNQLIIMDFETLGSIIFRGQATVTNGQFEFDFIVPRDIGIPVGLGKASFYAKNGETFQDHTGANVTELRIGGLNENAPEDNQGPLINLFMNDESFVSGGITNESPSLLVKLEDENGINTASGIGHDIVAIIDGDETNQYVLNDYYQTDLDVYQKGSLTYPFRDLSPGLHTLTVKAWDVYNNSSTSEIQFVVYDKDQGLVIDHVLNYPNPFVNYTEFWFNHNSPEPLNVTVQIFTVSGKLVKTLTGQTNTAQCCNQGGSTLSRDIIWDGRDDFGDRIGKGVYIYKLTVVSSTTNKRAEKIEKLVIL